MNFFVEMVKFVLFIYQEKNYFYNILCKRKEKKRKENLKVSRIVRFRNKRRNKSNFFFKGPQDTMI